MNTPVDRRSPFATTGRSAGSPAGRLGRRRVLHGLAAGAGALALGPAAAQSAPWPSRPVRFIVAWPPGGGTDAIARPFADRLGARLGQQVVIENRGGANAKIGTALAQQAAPDGYTFLFHSDTELPRVALNAQLTPKHLAFEPVRGMERVSMVGKGPYMLVTSAAFPATTLGEFLAHAKANPGKLNYGSFGTGSVNQFLTELLALQTGFKAVEVPYQGAGPVLTALAGGQIDFAFLVPGASMPLVTGGKIKAIAVLSPARLPNLPTVPTMAESGVPEFIGGSWYGLLAPAKTPEAIVTRMNAEVVALVASPEMQQVFQRLNVVPLTGSPQEMESFVQAELTKRRQMAAYLKVDLE